MSESSPVGTPSITLVAGLLPLMENTMGGVPSHAVAAAGLHGTQVLYDDCLFLGPTPIKSERKSGLGTLGFPGGGGYQGCFFGDSFSGEC
jgi:hypothetical protein